MYENETILEQPYTLTSEVVHGFKRGSTELGFPTANLDLESMKVSLFSYGKETLEPLDSLASGAFMTDMKTGVYIGCARIRDSVGGTPVSPAPSEYFPCVFSLGWNPTYNNTVKTLEAHFLDVDISSTLANQNKLPTDFYGATVDIHTLVYLRDEEKFDSLGRFLFIAILLFIVHVFALICSCVSCTLPVDPTPVCLPSSQTT